MSVLGIGTTSNGWGSSGHKKPKLIQGLMSEIQDMSSENVSQPRSSQWKSNAITAIISVAIMLALYLFNGGRGYQSGMSDIDDLKRRMGKVEDGQAEMQKIKEMAIQIQGELKAVTQSQGETRSDVKDLVRQYQDQREKNGTMRGAGIKDMP